MERQEDIIIYACKTNFCGFIFSSKEKNLKQCPDCGKFTLRAANEKERKLYLAKVGYVGETVI